MLWSKKVTALGLACCGFLLSSQALAGDWFTCPADAGEMSGQQAVFCAGQKAVELRTVQQSIKGKDGTTWWKCGEEGGVCRFRGTRQIGYGAKGKWFYRTYKDSVACNSGMFGGDPIVGVAKACYYQADTPDRPLASVDKTWQRCAGEGGACRFQGERRVAFGANGKWSYRIARNGVSCAVEKFGDPIVGVVKSCYIDPYY